MHVSEVLCSWRSTHRTQSKLKKSPPEASVDSPLLPLAAQPYHGRLAPPYLVLTCPANAAADG